MEEFHVIHNFNVVSNEYLQRIEDRNLRNKIKFLVT